MTVTQAGSSDDVGIERAEEFAREHPNLVKLGRVGWVAKGVVYALTGVLAIAVASQSASNRSRAGEEVSQSGAIATIADQPAGAVLLVAIAAGLLLYAVWRVVSLVLPAENTTETWITRTGYVVSATMYGVLAWSALSIARGPGGSEGSEDATVERFTRSLLEAGGGRFLVLVIGAGVIAAGGYFLHKGATASFMSDLMAGSVGPLSRPLIVTMGRVGWIGRGLMMGLIGFFLARAAVTFDADDAKGLDGSLRTVAGSAPGTVLIGAVALGLITYGAFCVASAPVRRLSGAD